MHKTYGKPRHKSLCEKVPVCLDLSSRYDVIAKLRSFAPAATSYEWKLHVAIGCIENMRDTCIVCGCGDRSTTKLVFGAVARTQG